MGGGAVELPPAALGFWGEGFWGEGFVVGGVLPAPCANCRGVLGTAESLGLAGAAGGLGPLPIMTCSERLVTMGSGP